MAQTPEKLLAKAKLSESNGELDKAVNYYERAAIFSLSFSEKESYTRDAERVASRISPERIVKVYEHLANKSEKPNEKSHYLLRGARRATSLNLRQLAQKLYKKSIKLEKNRNNYATAAKICEEAGLIEAAVKLYTQCGMADTASEVATKAKLDHLSVRAYEKAAKNAMPKDKADHFLKAARLAMHNVMYKKSMRHYKSAIRHYKKMGDLEKAEAVAVESGLKKRT
ncbi:hypothetical protein FJZ53_02940 [Candidatus Woesearchaeota archaeon]|nr:hypothetical protein [Candidatus Woesearchaeota archaeon]